MPCEGQEFKLLFVLHILNLAAYMKCGKVIKACSFLLFIISIILDLYVCHKGTSVPPKLAGVSVIGTIVSFILMLLGCCCSNENKNES